MRLGVGGGGVEQETVLLSLTHALINPARRRDFDRATLVLLGQLQRTPGLLMYSVRREVIGMQAWTMTAWRSDEDRSTFVTSEAHGTAMALAGKSIDRMRTRQLAICTGELPLRWTDALNLFRSADWSRGHDGTRNS
jgi:hypothetical protein